MNSVKQLLLLVMKACPCVGVSLFGLQVSSGFSGKAGADASTGQGFLCYPPEVAALAVWGMRQAGTRGARAGVWHGPGLLLGLLGAVALAGQVGTIAGYELVGMRGNPARLILVPGAFQSAALH